MQKMEEDLKKFKKKLLGEKRDSMATFEEYKTEQNQYNQKIRKEAKERMDDYDYDIRAVKKQYIQMQEQVERLIKNKSSLKNAHDEEMANFVREQNKK